MDNPIRIIYITRILISRTLPAVAAAPLGGGLMLISSYPLIANREMLAPAKGVPFIGTNPWVVVAILPLELGAAGWFRARARVGQWAGGSFVGEGA